MLGGGRLDRLRSRRGGARKGEGGPKDPRRAAELLALACEHRGLFRRIGPCTVLAEMYERGEGVAVDRGKADALRARVTQAFEQRCAKIPGSCVMLARLFLDGQARPRDPARGVPLLERTCDGGDRNACHEFAGRYTAGRGVARDAGKAGRARAREAALLDEDCRHDVAWACRTLAFYLERGVLPKDAARAAAPRARACQLGEPRSCKKLSGGGS